jgi:phage tail sheath protein FI
MSNFLHGVETVDVDFAGRSFTVVKSGVIGLVGIAPTGPRNQLILCTGERDFSQFGKPLPGFTIPQSLEVIANQGAGTVLVVNVFDEGAHTTQITAEAKTVTGGKLKLDAAPIGNVTVLDSAGAPITFISGTDYTIDEYGNFKVLSSLIAESVVLKFTYKKLNIAAVTSSIVIGEQNATTGLRSGMACWELSYNTYGFTPKILIAPGFSTLSAVASKLRALSDKYRAINYVDAPAGTTVSSAIAGRGPAGSIAHFNVSHQRTELLYPQLLKYDAATNGNVAFPYSAFLAGVRQAIDNDEAQGFWTSSSNHSINCEGVEARISFQLNDSDSETNLLNAAGITTVANAFGTGILTWGNRNSSYPSAAGQRSFSNITRTFDIVQESMEFAALPYVDKGITQALIDVMREEGNSFIRTLIRRGALPVGSKVAYNPDDNTAEELSNGHVVFQVIDAGIPPAERITFKHVLDIKLVSNLK